ncbi:MAG: hypothetical protein VKI81_11890 [Synechococcaceae cyanobacterium]|nr:hypothetical protein [Synechococcaceae cyanobacterium]
MSLDDRDRAIAATNLVFLLRVELAWGCAATRLSSGTVAGNRHNTPDKLGRVPRPMQERFQRRPPQR